MKLITLCFPIYNEEDNITRLYTEILTIIAPLQESYQFKLLFINDGSTDSSLEIIHTLQSSDNRVQYIDFSRNFGKDIALTAAFDHAEGDAIIIMDADLQHPPELIPQMIAEWEQGYHDVYGQRIARQQESFVRIYTSRIYYKVLNKISKHTVLQGSGDFRLLDRVCITALQKMTETQRYTTGMFTWIGYRKKAIPYTAQPRFAGTSKWRWPNLFSLAFNGILSYSIIPLRIASAIGIFTALLSLLYMIYIICTTLFFGNPIPGYPTIICLILFIGGIQLLAIGIVGEYIDKIHIEVKKRPNYLIQTITMGPNTP
ncbi:glycosyltransferase family 2 protein [Wohlfahrtiimonas larvae]|uniref:Glycosyltransferase family 2 protein n=1 Tax=Wohlfahrtiimonas larvae TaxID=1157986 RepID=A0ABP9MX06_9GAMM|nr:glycosyltransferase family 2 protein [Wohlfahrtiimonas larvae]